MKDTMKVAVMLEIGRMGFEERPIPEIKPNEILVKLEYVGVCGSDIHYYETGRIGNYVVQPPFVLGHESGGTVVKVGQDVKHLKIGDKVALEPGKTCGHCHFCREGKYNLCSDYDTSIINRKKSIEPSQGETAHDSMSNIQKKRLRRFTWRH